MNSKIKKFEWIIVYFIAGITDITQWILDAVAVGAVINPIADPIIGAIFAIYFQLRGVSMTQNINRLLSLIGCTALEELSVSVAPAWIFDVWYIHSTVRSEKAQYMANEQASMMLEDSNNMPLNENGVRAPRNQEEKDDRPLIRDGIRRPSGK
jgi:hypothetical protein